MSGARKDVDIIFLTLATHVMYMKLSVSCVNSNIFDAKSTFVFKTVCAAWWWGMEQERRLFFEGKLPICSCAHSCIKMEFWWHSRVSAVFYL